MIVQVLIPTVIALIVVGVIGDKQSAVSWYASLLSARSFVEMLNTLGPSFLG